MPLLPFSKWNPAGNTTLFFPKDALDPSLWPALAAETLKNQALSAEQAGFVDIPGNTLTMAGGEFCLNATLAFGALLARREEESKKNMEPGRTHTARVTVSGWPERIFLTCTGSSSTWHSRAQIPLPTIDCADLGDGQCLVRLPGISHLLLDRSKNPLESDRDLAQATFSQLRQRYQLEEEPCVGAIWWEKSAKMLRLTPLVFVRETQTLVWEQACGSGSLALALALGQSQDIHELSLQQPSGALLHVVLNASAQYATVAGEVRLVAEGMYWPGHHFASIPPTHKGIEASC
ncbi:MAG: hypothetical protein K6G15_01520 [Desulfovibrio sp.]|nr:hypothetical protein [Desulfovibrio sp.]